MRPGECDNSDFTENLFSENGDDDMQFESFRNTNTGANNRCFLNKSLNPYGPTFSHQGTNMVGTQFVYRNVVRVTDPSISFPEFIIKTIFTPNTCTVHHYHNSYEHLGNGTRMLWYDFSNGTGNRISLRNNVIFFKNGISPATNVGGPNPTPIGGNLFIGPVANAQVQAGGGAYGGVSKEAAGVNAEFTLQADSPARGLAIALPGSFPDVAGLSKADAGAFPFGFNPGSVWPRPNNLAFDTVNLPVRWTSPGASQLALFFLMLNRGIV
jgi:hypothetical protein